MGRKITQEEIDSLKEWNKTARVYVSVEAYQDLLDWMPDPQDISDEYKKAIFLGTELDDEPSAK